MFYGMDPTWILLIPAILLSLYAQIKVKNTYNKFARVSTRAGIPAHHMVRQMLDMNGLQNVTVVPVGGKLTDHYDPKKKELRLSQENYNSSSVAALGVAAHECGHALQDAEGYAPLRIRSSLVPVANFGSNFSWILILAGVLFSFDKLISLGIIFFAAAVVFQLVTLPVEFNASSRAMAALEGASFLNSQELPQAKKVLNAAALTYVAAAFTAILQLLRLILLYGRRDK
ncbi:MAG: zinc metallopeptidase [Bacillota bacterium]|nr:zinc metallopeptidase [Bacillota bacterium]